MLKLLGKGWMFAAAGSALKPVSAVRMARKKANEPSALRGRDPSVNVSYIPIGTKILTAPPADVNAIVYRSV